MTDFIEFTQTFSLKSTRCLEGVWRVSVGCLLGVCMVSGRCLEVTGCVFSCVNVPSVLSAPMCMYHFAREYCLVTLERM